MQAMASRTLVFNPTDKQKEAYDVAYNALQHAMDKLTPGTALSEVYNSTLAFIKAKNPSLGDKVHTNFGFGIGSKYKEDELSISQANSSTLVENGMVFHLRITFRDVENPKSKGPIALGDTVIVSEGGTELITGQIARKWSNVSYTLDEEDEDGSEDSGKQDKNKEARNKKSTQAETGDEIRGNEGAILPTRTRRGNVNQAQQNVNMEQ